MTSEVVVGFPEKVFDGEGGAYYAWTPSKMSVLADAKVGACRLVLAHQGFAFPHFGDSTKIGFVLQGSGKGMAGLISTDTKKETVVSLKKGDCITVGRGVASWWYNPDDSSLDIIFMGETVDAIVPGYITYQFFSGTNGFLNSFSPEFISSLYNISLQQSTRLATSQPGFIAVKLPAGEGPELSLPKQPLFNFSHVSPHMEVTCGAGMVKRFTSGEDDLVKVGPEDGVELCAFQIRLEPGKGIPPFYMVRPATQVFFVVKGTVWVQILRGGGGCQMDRHVEPGYLFVVPMFYTVSMVAGDEGVECLSLMNTSKPLLGQLGNMWSAMSPATLQAALNLNRDIENSDTSTKIKEALIIDLPGK